MQSNEIIFKVSANKLVRYSGSFPCISLSNTIPHKSCNVYIPIMLALCLMLSATYYAQNYAGIIGWSLAKTHTPHASEPIAHVGLPIDFI